MRATSATLVCLLAGLLAAAPPDVPKAVTAEPGELVRVVIKTDSQVGTLRNFTDGTGQPFWGELIAPKGQRHFVFQAPKTAKPGTEYVIGWWAAGELEGVATTITVGGTPDPIVKPPPVDPVKPPPVTESYYFAVIRPNQMTQDVADALKLPAWKELEAKGHVYKDIPVKELPEGIPLPATLPALVMLKKNADGKTWTVVPGAKPLPTTDDAIRGLLK